MAKSNDTMKETWGTWEELLLASAVNRHGTNSWDSVAMEIQNRSCSLHLLTPQNCKQKYHDLNRRFIAKDDKTIIKGVESEPPKDMKDEIPWLEDLRKLRVAELRREVQRYDVSIVSLQLKVNRLKEEREQSLRSKENDEQKPDLETNLDKERVKEEERDTKSDKSSPENVAGEPVPGEESDRDNQSFNESNSTDPKTENRDNGVEGAEKKPVPVEPVVGPPDPVSGESKHVGEGSYHGSNDTIAKELAAQPVLGTSEVPNTARETSDSPESWESVAESKGGGEEGHKESSDVQSSASLSRKNRRKKAIYGSSSGEEPEADEVSPAIKRIYVKSQPLIAFLEIIRSHKFGSVFERRHESQETVKYKNLIRQHVDLETIRTRLEEGCYSGCSRKFFRDLLLLFNNASVFFPENSPESIAAVTLRQLVSKEMAIRARNPDCPKEEEEAAAAAAAAPVPAPAPAPAPPVPPPSKLEPSDSEPSEPKSSVPIIVCRKRSSISTKPSPAVIDKKGEQRTSTVVDEKPVPDRKQPGSFPNAGEEQSLTKKSTRERSGLGARSNRTSSKSRTNTNNTNKNPSAGPGQNHTLGPNSGSADRRSVHEETKTERKNNTIATVAKKRSAANFLNRMKRSSNGTLLETLKNPVNSSNSGKGSGGGGELGAEQKRGGGKSDGRKDHVKDHGSRQQNYGGKQAAEQSSPAKRSVGRPPKRATVTAPPPLPPPAPSKRMRETTSKEVVASRQSRKRARR
ncbi:hypothetical protein NE237_010452 [Protea cynaroides]|uniref:Bromo domain-containing protein n=1 Tax=Protea cynaroides TaxID=273540 RepID=A0A9Q0KZB9_9MAGN|nr:hypothetical protein NE237_010452 [Protea cynaroides]